MKFPAVSDPADEAQFLQAIGRTDDRSAAHADQFSDAVQAGIALAGPPIKMVNDGSCDPLFGVR
jgi:hypothetical protein